MEPEKQNAIVDSVPSYFGWDDLRRTTLNLYKKQPDFSKVTTKVKYNPEIIAQYNQDLDSIPGKRRAAILANIIHESQGNPEAEGDYDKEGNSLAYGLLQWHPDRFNRSVWNANRPDYQLRYMVGSLRIPKNNNWIRGGKKSGYRSANQVQRSFYNDNNSIHDITKALVWGYVRPKNQARQVEERSKTAEEIYRRIRSVENKKNGGILQKQIFIVPNNIPEEFRNYIFEFAKSTFNF